jgi:hypothetical protein
VRTIQLEIPDELAERLVPYREHLAELLELGLNSRERSEQETLKQVLTRSGKIVMPESGIEDPGYERHTPVPITGQPVSEIVIEQRGPQ